MGVHFSHGQDKVVMEFKKIIMDVYTALNVRTDK